MVDAKIFKKNSSLAHSAKGIGTINAIKN